MCCCTITFIQSERTQIREGREEGEREREQEEEMIKEFKTLS